MPTIKKIKKLKKTRRKKINQTKLANLVNAVEIKDKCKAVGLIPIEQYTEKNLKDNDKLKKIFVNSLYSKFAMNIQPNDDFYTYINYLWMKNNVIAEEDKYLTQIDNFRLTQKKVYIDMHNLIIDYVKHTSGHPHKARLKRFYNAAFKQNKIGDTQKVAQNILHQVDEIRKNKNNLWKLIAFFNRSQMFQNISPFVVTMKADYDNPKIFRPYVEVVHFPIVDKTLYIRTDTEAKKYKKEYHSYVHDLFEGVLGKTHGLPTDNVFELFVEFYKASISTDVSKTNNYTKVYADEALTKYGFNWTELATEMGFNPVPKFFITNNLNYLKNVSTFLQKEWYLDKWKPMWVGLHFRTLSRITKGLEYIYYNHYGKYDVGQEKMIADPRINTPIYASVAFNATLTNLYIEHYGNIRISTYVEILCNDLKEIFMRFVSKNNWLTPSTKKYALKKLEYLKFIIGNPHKLRNDPKLPYGDNFYENLEMFYAWRNSYYVKLDGMNLFDIPMIDWTAYPIKMTSTQAYIVNASYTPMYNNIYINLGYMQKPFIDLDMSIEYNLANIGFTIAHELSHALDNSGRHFDYDGRLHNWWTDADIKKYNSIQNDIIKQYNDWAERDHKHFDASIGIGEDIADISGLAICDEYLRNFQNYKDLVIPTKLASYELFYTNFAKQMRQIIPKRAAKAQSKINPHPDDKYRTNVPLSRSQIFRALYNVQKENDMYWHNMNVVW